MINSKFLSVSSMNTLLAILKVSDARRNVILADGLNHRFPWRHPRPLHAREKPLLSRWYKDNSGWEKSGQWLLLTFIRFRSDMLYKTDNKFNRNTLTLNILSHKVLNLHMCTLYAIIILNSFLIHFNNPTLSTYCDWCLITCPKRSIISPSSYI